MVRIYFETLERLKPRRESYFSEGLELVNDVLDNASRPNRLSWNGGKGAL